MKPTWMPASALDVYRNDLLGAASTFLERNGSVVTSDRRTLHLRALLLARQDGGLAAAIACIAHAVETDNRGDADIECERLLGALLSQAGRHDQSLTAYLSALARSPRDKALHVHVARSLQALGRLREADAFYRWALQLEPGCARTRGELGELLCTRGRLDDAVDCGAAAVTLAPDDADVHLRLGRIHLARREWSLAIASFHRGLDLQPDLSSLHVGMGDALLGDGRGVEALASFKAALIRQPDDLYAARGLVSVVERLHDADAPAPEAASAWCHLAAVLQSHRRYEESVEAYARAVSLAPDSVAALAGLAGAQIAVGRPAETIAPARAALARVPYDTALRMELATAYHLLGDLPSGWDEFARIYDARTLKQRGRGFPLWDGSPLDGRTLLLWTDMGRGDVIQFLRYIAPVARDGGGRVIVQCHHPRLVPLIERIAGVHRVVAPGSPLPYVDVQAPLNFFPAFVPSYRSMLTETVPYLTADPTLVARWRDRLGPTSARIVGLSWSGNADTLSAHGRFVTLAQFASLRDAKHLRFVSLQHGPQAAELLSSPRGLHVEGLLDESSSIDDAAALVSCLDLVITVDTMIAHLAGALGKPVWTLLRYATNWRWGLTDNRTAWYPTMRLFRQTKPGNWDDVFVQISEALDDRTHDPADGERSLAREPAHAAENPRTHATSSHRVNMTSRVKPPSKQMP